MIRYIKPGSFLGSLETWHRIGRAAARRLYAAALELEQLGNCDFERQPQQLPQIKALAAIITVVAVESGADFDERLLDFAAEWTMPL